MKERLSVPGRGFISAGEGRPCRFQCLVPAMPVGLELCSNWGIFEGNSCFMDPQNKPETSFYNDVIGGNTG